MSGEAAAVTPERFDKFHTRSADGIEIRPENPQRKKRGGGGKQVGGIQLICRGEAAGTADPVEQYPGGDFF